MVGESTVESGVPLGKPPDWANAWMRRALTAPGIQKIVGRGAALLSFDGRRTGRRYTIPVSYHRDDDVVTVVTKRRRRWWRNFLAPIEVEFRLAGRSHSGTASIVTDDSEVLDFMVEYLRARPIDAKAYGLTKEELTTDGVARIVPDIVVIRGVIDDD